MKCRSSKCQQHINKDHERKKRIKPYQASKYQQIMTHQRYLNHMKSYQTHIKPYEMKSNHIKPYQKHIKPYKTGNLSIRFSHIHRFPGHRGGETPPPRAAQGPEHRARRGRGGAVDALRGGGGGKPWKCPWILYI